MPHRFASLTRRGLAAVAVALAAVPAQAAGDPLPSWREGPAKRSILSFVDRATRRGTPDHRTPAMRVAVFDNDGTLWVEQPLYTQLAFAIDRLRELAQRDPALAARDPFKAALAGDLARKIREDGRGL